MKRNVKRRFTFPGKRKIKLSQLSPGMTQKTELAAKDMIITLIRVQTVKRVNNRLVK